jgi:hypothetical protein
MSPPGIAGRLRVTNCAFSSWNYLMIAVFVPRPKGKPADRACGLESAPCQWIRKVEWDSKRKRSDRDRIYELSTRDRKTSDGGPINAIFFDWEHGSFWGGSSNHGEDYGIAW